MSRKEELKAWRIAKAGRLAEHVLASGVEAGRLLAEGHRPGSAALVAHAEAMAVEGMLIQAEMPPRRHATRSFL
jgi:hypothetical protein